MTEKRRPKRLDLRGFSKGGSVVVAVSKDGELFKIRCKCDAVYQANRVHVRNARIRERNMHCSECHCKNMQRIATEAAAKRSRVGGMFAKEHNQFTRENP